MVAIPIRSCCCTDTIKYCTRMNPGNKKFFKFHDENGNMVVLSQENIESLEKTLNERLRKWRGNTFTYKISRYGMWLNVVCMGCPTNNKVHIFF